MTGTTLALAAFALFTVLDPAVAADVAGSADYPGIGRYAGSEILEYEVEDYGQTVFATGPVQKEADAESTALSVEGSITRIRYRAPEGVSALEVFRNFFDHDSATLKAESKPTLDEIAELMNSNPEYNVIVVGHTDNAGAVARGHPHRGALQASHRRILSCRASRAPTGHP